MLLLFFLCLNFEIDVILFLALLVIFARAYLCTLLRCTVLVLETPVSDLKHASLSVLFLIIVRLIFDHVKGELLEMLESSVSAVASSIETVNYALTVSAAVFVFDTPNIVIKFKQVSVSCSFK